MFTYLSAGKPIISTFPNKYDLITKFGCGKTVEPDDIDESLDDDFYPFERALND